MFYFIYCENVNSSNQPFFPRYVSLDIKAENLFNLQSGFRIILPNEKNVLLMLMMMYVG